MSLENDKGERHTAWGADLERAMEDAVPEIGEKIGLQHLGSTPVTLPDGTQTHRNTWKVRDAGELAYEQLESRLSRSGAKETTLDYTRDFAARRGIAARHTWASAARLRFPAIACPTTVPAGSRRSRIMSFRKKFAWISPRIGKSIVLSAAIGSRD